MPQKKSAKRRPKKSPAELLAAAREKLHKNSPKYRDKKEYLKAYREQKGDELNIKRKSRYHTDPEYRARCIERAMESYRKRKEEVQRLRKEGLLPPARKKRTTATKAAGHRVCPMCNRPFSPMPKAALMVIGKKYQVAMFQLGELAYRLGKNPRTLISWVADKFMPDSQYKSRTGRRLWTQDQVEMFMRVCSSYDLRPPVSFVKCGFVAELLVEWNKLRETKGINPALYTVSVEHGLLKRESTELPPPISAAEEKKSHADKTKTRAA